MVLPIFWEKIMYKISRKILLIVTCVLIHIPIRLEAHGLPCFESGLDIGTSFFTYTKFDNTKLGVDIDANYHYYLLNMGFSSNYTMQKIPNYQLVAGIGLLHFLQIQLGYDFDNWLIRFRTHLFLFNTEGGQLDQSTKRVNLIFKLDKEFNSSPLTFKIGIGYLF